MENNPAIAYLKVLIKYYKDKRDNLKPMTELSYSAFLDYINVKQFLNELQNLYFKLTDKEYKD